MEKMRKLGRKTVICFLTLCLISLLFISGCTGKSNNESGGGSGSGGNDTPVDNTATVEFSTPLIDLQDDQSKINPKEDLTSQNLIVEETYYFVLETTMTTKKYTSNASAIINIELENATYINVDIIDVSTKEVTRIPSTDPSEKRFTASYSVPNEGHPLKLRVIMTLKPTMADSKDVLSLEYSFYGDIKTTNGTLPSRTLKFSVVKNKIATPQLEYDDSQDMLYWYQVKGATYYKIYVDGDKNTEYEVPADRKDEGLRISLSVSSLNITGPHKIYIEAYSNNANYIHSDSSNIIQSNS